MLASLFVRLPVVICALALAPAAFSQERRSLKINVIEGEGAFNDIRGHFAHNVVIEVRDDADHLVTGANVVFSAPVTGVGVTFANGGKTLITTTDDQGRASAKGLKPNSLEGRFTIDVRASAASGEGRTQVAQSNTLAGGKALTSGKSKKAILLAALGAAASVGIALALNGGHSAPPPAAIPVTTLSPGTISVGGPR
jgi:hypothetical protein